MIAAIIFGVYVAREPRTLEYCLDDAGLRIAGKFYYDGQFCSFAGLPEGTFQSITHVHLKRKCSRFFIYSPEDEQKITPTAC